MRKTRPNSQEVTSPNARARRPQCQLTPAGRTFVSSLYREKVRSRGVSLGSHQDGNIGLIRPSKVHYRGLSSREYATWWIVKPYQGDSGQGPHDPGPSTRERSQYYGYNAPVATTATQRHEVGR